jgi:hypothetical protein
MKLLRYILICSFLFALLDWKVIHYTRWSDRSWLEWMHAHEGAYAAMTNSLELALCAPAMALKPVFAEALKRVEASQEEQDAVTHAPGVSLAGFYHLPVRGESWTFVPWSAWLLYWTPIGVIWYLVVKRLYDHD